MRESTVAELITGFTVSDQGEKNKNQSFIKTEDLLCLACNMSLVIHGLVHSDMQTRFTCHCHICGLRWCICKHRKDNNWTHMLLSRCQLLSCVLQKLAQHKRIAWTDRESTGRHAQLAVGLLLFVHWGLQLHQPSCIKEQDVYLLSSLANWIHQGVF